MLFNDQALSELDEIAQMRGILLGRHRLEQISREIDKRGGISYDQFFDRLRQLGASFTFQQERGLRQALDSIEECRVQRNARADREYADAKRRMAATFGDDSPAPAPRRTTTKNTGYSRRYTGRELQQLLARDVDARGKLRGPVLGHKNGLIREDF